MSSNAVHTAQGCVGLRNCSGSVALLSCVYQLIIVHLLHNTNFLNSGLPTPQLQGHEYDGQPLSAAPVSRGSGGRQLVSSIIECISPSA